MRLMKNAIRQYAMVSALVCAGAVTGGQAMAADGQQLYNATCGLCHQVGATGVPGQFPPLKGRIDQIAATPEGKTYLAHVLLNGLSGSIKAGGQSYMGYMPAFAAQSDETLAAILTYVASLGETKPAPTFSADDIKAARTGGPLAPTAILDERNKLNAAHPVP
ncbi:UNVERIFIED_CONTAM: cytochrome c553 [Acetobacter peroxydans]|jgi:mono/diheme cytochrome c family protein